tara:strand:- start:183 stop:554 length:372 start_codon:yes stop_codon:yes gene_type:complete
MDKKKQSRLKKLGLLISKERKAKSLSLRDFAGMVGLSHVAISHIEKGKVEAKKDTLLNIAHVLEYDIDTMLGKASKLDDDIENLIYEKSDTVPLFLRTAKNLSKEQWREITEKVKEMKKKVHE